VDSGTILLNESSGWMDTLVVLASGMIRPRGTRPRPSSSPGVM
jgi:hypothetical protein